MLNRRGFWQLCLLAGLFWVLGSGFWGCSSVSRTGKTAPSTSAARIARPKTIPAPPKVVFLEAPSQETVSPTPQEKEEKIVNRSGRERKKTADAREVLPSAPQAYQPLKETQKKEKPLFNIPIVMNPLVENFIKYYQTTGRKQFSIWLARSERYIPMMRRVLKEHGLPTDLVYLAMIESGFNPTAYSRSRASGPWQFISGTGRKYGLKVNYWIDERRDPEKSTIAAARYLKDLYDQFESWHLAAAAYNCGEGKLNRAIKRYKTEDYWQLIKHHYLKRETRLYVPQMIAAALIAKEPEKYGFTNIQYQEPLIFEQALVPGGVTLRDIAKACHCQEQTLRMLNPELIRRCTPPYKKRFVVKIPKGSKQILAMNMGVLKPVVKGTPRGYVHTHIVRRGDSLYKLALRYKSRVKDIRYLNHIHGNLIHVGQRLIIPVGRVHRTKYARKEKHRVKTAMAVSRKHHVRMGRSPGNGRYKEFVYVVRKGDNLWSIARNFNIHVKDICRLNPHVNKRTTLHPRDRLKLRVPMAEFSSLPATSRQAIQ